ncbi:hypothetical protein BYT27DRAFT_7195860 [Phlegmacium glaucopus]|nr:hypothetical protein BYT27DRAFT_7195860 [Phlegmacium glaucopus]
MNCIEGVNLKEKIDNLLLSQGSPPEAERVKILLNISNDKLRDISCDLDRESRSGIDETMEKLESGLMKLHEFAVFIRRDYDDYDPGQGPTAALLGQLHQAFTMADTRAECGLKAIGDLHAQVMEFQSVLIMPLREKIALMIQNNSTQLTTTQSSISSTQQAIQTFDQSVRQQEDSIRSLESKMSDTMDVRIATGAAAHLLTFGLATLFAWGFPDPFNLEDDLADARRARDEVENQRNSTLNRISNLRSEEQRLQELLSQGRQLEGQLPQLSDTAVATQSRCVTLQSRFSTLKDTASRLASQVKRVVGDMSIVKQAVTKEEFAVLLLNLCSDATLVLHHDATLIDSDLRLVDAIKAVEGELVGYETRLLGGIEDEWD